MKHFLIILMLFHYVSGNAQGLFNKTFLQPSNNCWMERALSTSDGGFLVSGNIYYSPYSSPILIKFDANGDTTWSVALTNWVDSLYLIITSIIEIPSGGYVASGYLGDKGILCGLNNSGEISWIKSYSNDPLYTYEFRNLIKTADDSLMIVGDFFSGNIDSSFLMKTDYSGNPSWQSGGPFGLGYYHSSAISDRNGDIVVASGGTIAKFDLFGNIKWSHGYDHSDNYVFYDLTGIDTLEDGGYIATVSFGDNVWLSYQAQYYMKLDSAGDIVWWRSFYNSFANFGYGQAYSLPGNKIGIAATTEPFYQLFFVIADTLGLPETTLLDTSQDDFIFMTKTDSGKLLFLSGAWEGNEYYHNIILTDSVGEALCGQNTAAITFPDTTTNTQKHPLAFSLSPTSINVSPVTNFTSQHENFLLFFKCSQVGTDEPATPVEPIVYPVPAQSEINVVWKEKISATVLFDLQGKMIYCPVISRGTNALLIDVSALPSGLYFLKVSNEQNELWIKVVRE